MNFIVQFRSSANRDEAPKLSKLGDIHRAHVYPHVGSIALPSRLSVPSKNKAGTRKLERRCSIVRATFVNGNAREPDRTNGFLGVQAQGPDPDENSSVALRRSVQM